MVNEDAALLNRRVTHMTPSHFSNAVYKKLNNPQKVFQRAQ
jgi:hypothetical protein